jgi:hypothetical protein
MLHKVDEDKEDSASVFRYDFMENDGIDVDVDELNCNNLIC